MVGRYQRYDMCAVARCRYRSVVVYDWIRALLVLDFVMLRVYDRPVPVPVPVPSRASSSALTRVFLGLTLTLHSVRRTIDSSSAFILL